MNTKYKIRRVMRALGARRFLDWMPDKLYLRWMYYACFGKKLDLKHPVTYNEKLQWIKLYDHNPLYTQLVDKYAVRDYIAKKIGEEYLIPLLGRWDNPRQIDFDALPEQFVLKCNHDSGSVIICKDKSKFDQEKAIHHLERCLKRGTYHYGREWPYVNVKPCVIAEAYMEDAAYHELRDYKFFAFDGEVKALFIATDRMDKSKPTAFDFFDAEYHHLDLRHGHPNAEVLPQKPMNFDEMIKLAQKLSAGLPEIRVDFYEVNGKTYFGELTLFHHAGFVPFDPEKWDAMWGNWIHLPEKRL